MGIVLSAVKTGLSLFHHPRESVEFVGNLRERSMSAPCLLRSSEARVTNDNEAYREIDDGYNHYISLFGCGKFDVNEFKVVKF